MRFDLVQPFSQPEPVDAAGFGQLPSGAFAPLDLIDAGFGVALSFCELVTAIVGGEEDVRFGAHPV